MIYYLASSNRIELKNFNANSSYLLSMNDVYDNIKKNGQLHLNETLKKYPKLPSRLPALRIEIKDAVAKLQPLDFKLFNSKLIYILNDCKNLLNEIDSIDKRILSHSLMKEFIFKMGENLVSGNISKWRSDLELKKNEVALLIEIEDAKNDFLSMVNRYKSLITKYKSLKINVEKININLTKNQINNLTKKIEKNLIEIKNFTINLDANNLKVKKHNNFEKLCNELEVNLNFANIDYYSNKYINLIKSIEYEILMTEGWISGDFKIFGDNSFIDLRSKIHWYPLVSFGNKTLAEWELFFQKNTINIGFKYRIPNIQELASIFLATQTKSKKKTIKIKNLSEFNILQSPNALPKEIQKNMTNKCFVSLDSASWTEKVRATLAEKSELTEIIFAPISEIFTKKIWSANIGMELIFKPVNQEEKLFLLVIKE